MMLWYFKISSITRNGVTTVSDANIEGFEIPLIFSFSEILVSEQKPDKVRKLQFSALRTLAGHLRYYKSLGYMDSLLYAIAEKKGKLILEITSKTEMDKLMKPHAPHYNGAEFIPDEYNIPEEELICWSEASFIGPLNNVGYKRYMQVFSEVFPEEGKTLLQS